MRRPSPRRLRRLHPALPALALAGCLATACAGPAEPPPLRAPGANLLLISIDTLRADRLSLLGYDRPTTPRLEALAGEGVVFERFFHNGGGTLPSHMTLFTSLHPFTHRVEPTTDCPPERRPCGGVLGPSWTTMAESLRAAGYRTAAFTDAGWMRGRFGFARGFDDFDDSGGRLERILPAARSWLTRHREAGDGRPFFLFLHTYDVHSQGGFPPYHCADAAHERWAGAPPEGFDGCLDDGSCGSPWLRSLVQARKRGELLEISERLRPEDVAYLSDLYDGCIRYVDEQLGVLFAELDQMRLFDPTMIVVLSDHGEEFLDHGGLVHATGGYEEIFRVPLVMKLPGSRLGGRRVTQLGAMVDVMPTVLDLLAVEAPEQLQGRSLVPAMLAGAPVREAVHGSSALRTERWKYLPDRRLLFDLDEDPRELVDVSADRPELADSLRRRFLELRDRDLAAGEEAARPETEVPAILDPEEEAELRALGYID